MEPRQGVFFVYDASISCTESAQAMTADCGIAVPYGLILAHDADANYEGDTFPAYAAIITPLGCLALSLVAYEFFIFKSCDARSSGNTCVCFRSSLS